MRGTAEGAREKFRLVRFIPAHAGNRRSPARRPWPGPVHPRACGEQDMMPEWDHSPCGSSPRMRGTVRQPQPPLDMRRFIPAHAGNRRSPIHGTGGGAVHPRACGEQRLLVSLPRPANGSSPRMRGTAELVLIDWRRDRFIPAHAGNSEIVGSWFVEESVHPRACGEQSIAVSGGRAQVGSSPRMRGTAVRGLDDKGRRRFIPAHAGNSRSPSPDAAEEPVHPRACGEQSVPVPDAIPHDGSSPRMRGTATRADRLGFQVRFIPAHAGNSASARWTASAASVHPRACGEQPAVAVIAVTPFGSSPRMRGTALSSTCTSEDIRFIPAHAGNSAPAGRS